MRELSSRVSLVDDARVDITDGDVADGERLGVVVEEPLVL